MGSGGWVFALADDDFARALDGFGWEEAYVRELSIVSPSQLLPSGSVRSPSATPDVRLVIATPTPPLHGVDIHVHLAEEVRIRGGSPLAATVQVGRTRVDLVLGPEAGRVRGRSLRFRLLERDDVAGATVLGRSYPPESDFDDDRFWRPR